MEFVHLSSSELLSDAVGFHEKYLELPENAKEFVEKSFAKLMTTKFVFT